MNYYPVFLHLKDRLVLLIGGGEVARQKLRHLLKCRAAIRVVAKEAGPEIHRLARDGKIKWFARAYRTADLKGVSLVIAATDDPNLQKRIASEARARGLWVNVVDVPPLCDFIAPAVVNRGGVQIAVSTGGAAPALAKFLRQKLETFVGPEYARFIQLVRPLRQDILKLPKPRRRALWKRLASDSFLESLRTQGMRKAKNRLKELMHKAESPTTQRGGRAPGVWSSNHG